MARSAYRDLENSTQAVDTAGVEPSVYYERLREGLAAIYGRPRITPTVSRFGDIGIECECIGPVMIIFLTKLDWTRQVSWEGAVHLDMRTLPIAVAVKQVSELIEIGRRRMAPR